MHAKVIHRIPYRIPLNVHGHDELGQSSCDAKPIYTSGRVHRKGKK